MATPVPDPAGGFAILPSQADYTVATVDRCAWATIVGCDDCRHSFTWRPDDLAAKFPPSVTMGAIARRLRCARCGSQRGQVAFVQDTRTAGERSLARHVAETGGQG